MSSAPGESDDGAVATVQLTEWRGDIAVSRARKLGRPVMEDMNGELFVALLPEEMATLDPESRYHLLNRMSWHSSTMGSPYYDDWEDFWRRCPHEDDMTGKRCEDRKWPGYKHCLEHATSDDLDPDGAVKRRAAQARVRMAELLEDGVRAVEDVLSSTDGDISLALRLKAAELVFDRAGVPKRTESTLEGTVDVVHHDAAELVARRLDALRENLLPPAAADDPDIQDAEVVDDA
jgi:hypothetical protein